MDLETIGGIWNRLDFPRLSKPALIGIVALLVMVAVAAGRLLIGTATANEFEIIKTESAAESQRNEVGSQEPATVFVHVSGEVANPGLVEVASGSRVADAVKAAGGFTQDAEAGSVNLARVLSDGEQVVIARHFEGEAVEAGSGAAAQQAGASGGASQSSGGLVNINTASAAELVSLPGIGEATATKIVSDRQANGSFKTVEDLKRVSGIGDKKFEALSGLICV